MRSVVAYGVFLRDADADADVDADAAAVFVEMNRLHKKKKEKRLDFWPHHNSRSNSRAAQ